MVGSLNKTQVSRNFQSNASVIPTWQATIFEKYGPIDLKMNEVGYASRASIGSTKGRLALTVVISVSFLEWKFIDGEFELDKGSLRHWSVETNMAPFIHTFYTVYDNQEVLSYMHTCMELKCISTIHSETPIRKAR